MVSPLLYVLAAITTITASTASSLTLTIPSSNILPNPQVLPPTTHATLTTLPAPPHAAQDAKHILSAPLTSSGTFVFPAVQGTSGKESYLLDIRSREYVFAPYRVDVAADGRILGIWETFRGNQWDNRGAEKYTAPVGGTSHQQAGNEVMVEAKVLARRGFYEERPRFSPLSLLKNPMLLLAVFALAATFGMPKLLENMDPEMRDEFEKQSRSGPLSGAGRSALAAGGGPGGASGFDIAGWMAGATTSPMGSAEGAAADASSNARGVATGREGGSGTRRRG